MGRDQEAEDLQAFFYYMVFTGLICTAIFFVCVGPKCVRRVGARRTAPLRLALGPASVPSARAPSSSRTHFAAYPVPTPVVMLGTPRTFRRKKQGIETEVGTFIAAGALCFLGLGICMWVPFMFDSGLENTRGRGL